QIGRRHAGFYNNHNHLTTSIAGDPIKGRVLVQRGIRDTSAQDPDRQGAYSEPDGDPDADGNPEQVNLGNQRLYTSWIDGWAYDEINRTPLLTPGRTFTPGHFFEIEVNFGHMSMEGHRHSFWLMPAFVDEQGQVPDPGTAYNNIAADGVEIDIYEHEYFGSHRPNAELFGNMLFMKVLGGDAGNTENQIENTPTGFSYNDEKRTAVVVSSAAPFGRISDGWHRIGLLWTTERLVWFVDGVAVVVDTEKVPQVPMYMILSREMNSGVKDAGADGFQPDTDAAAQPPAIPADPGLLSRNVATQRNLAKLATPADPNLEHNGEFRDHVRVNYVKVWSVGSGRTSDSVVTGTRYDGTQGEIFWEKFDHTEFNVYRDDILQTAQPSNGNSFFQNSLIPGTVYHYRVSALTDSGELTLGFVILPGSAGPGTSGSVPVTAGPAA
ncbi:MAG: glycoside hydrolase family 16 protein, partial [Granulosicoccus sp.]|nr:glycoside hydrolase family 16 protein [Granulosicoccus sp.]